MSDVFDIGPYKGRIDVDFGAIVKQWQEWSKKCKDSKGASIGVMSKNKSLYVFLKNHGLVGRKVITDKKKNTKEKASLRLIRKFLFSYSLMNVFFK